MSERYDCNADIPEESTTATTPADPVYPCDLPSLLVVTAMALVHVLPSAAEESAQIPHLPEHVADIRDAILAAARSGNIDELKAVIRNERRIARFRHRRRR